MRTSGDGLPSSQGSEVTALLLPLPARFGIETFVNLKSVYSIIRRACSAWADDDAPSMGAALAFYTVFSLARS